MDFLAKDQEYRFDIINPAGLPQDYIELLDYSRHYDLGRPDIGAAELIRLSSRLEAQVWLFQSKSGGYGFVVTQVLAPHGMLKELYIWRLIGHGMYQWFKEIDAALQDFARKNNCARIRAVLDPKLARLVINDNTQYKSIGVMIAKEL